MASFNRFSRKTLRLSLFVMCAVLGGACSAQFSTDFDAKLDGDDNNFTGDSANVGSGGGGVIVPPDQPAPAESTSFADLCGGGCSSSDETLQCPTEKNPDGTLITSCQIVQTDLGPVAECLPPGAFKTGEPCERASDCAPSLGCVRVASDVSVCRPYCCGDIEACQASSYCSLGVMAEDVSPDKPTVIPVCIPATPCTLLDDTTCPEGRTCTLVRADGTTSCVQPGIGKIGDPCPCSAGHVCSIALGKCLALCRVGASDCPDMMLCQGGSEGFPDGIGVCVK